MVGFSPPGNALVKFPDGLEEILTLREPPEVGKPLNAMGPAEDTWIVTEIDLPADASEYVDVITVERLPS